MTGIRFIHLPGDDLEPVLVGEPLSPHTVQLRRQERGGLGNPIEAGSLTRTPEIRATLQHWDAPHGMKTITAFQNGWDTIKVIGDVRPVDIPSLRSAAQSAFRRRPVRLAIDLAEVNSCDSEGIRWILETRQRIARCGGELRVVVPGRVDPDRRGDRVSVIVHNELPMEPDVHSGSASETPSTEFSPLRGP